MTIWPLRKSETTRIFLTPTQLRSGVVCCMIGAPTALVEMPARAHATRPVPNRIATVENKTPPGLRYGQLPTRPEERLPYQPRSVHPPNRSEHELSLTFQCFALLATAYFHDFNSLFRRCAFRDHPLWCDFQEGPAAAVSV